MSISGDNYHIPTPLPHIAVITSTGMGHLTPLLRLAAVLLSSGHRVTLVTFHPLVSSAESRHISNFLSSFPNVFSLELELPISVDSSSTANDPFFLQVEAIHRSTHLLSSPLSSSSPPLSALVTDIFLFATINPIAKELRLPNYVFFPSSAAMLALVIHFPHSKGPSPNGDIEIPGLASTVPGPSLPQPLHDPTSLFTKRFVDDGRSILTCDGVLINTFYAMEKETLSALNSGAVAAGVPPVFVIGPLQPLSSLKKTPFPLQPHISWLFSQPESSVVYVSFGSRTAMSKEQIRELGVGLEKSGCRFLWVVKTKKVDKDEEEDEVHEGDEYMKRVEGRGLVVKRWVEQEEILCHKAVGGFLSHCGWNSVMEAATIGVRMLAWPRNGDQRINAEVVERSGLGRWVREWSWEWEAPVVGGEEIGIRVREFMEDARVEESAARVKEEAVRAIDLQRLPWERPM